MNSYLANSLIKTNLKDVRRRLYFQIFHMIEKIFSRLESKIYSINDNFTLYNIFLTFKNATNIEIANALYYNKKPILIFNHNK